MEQARLEHTLPTLALEKEQPCDIQGKPDADLLRRYAEQRSEEAFTELRRRYVRLIFATCRRETGDPMLAEDAAQGVLLLLSQKAGQLTRVDALAGWLYMSSRHVARNLVKQERRRQMNEARAAQEAISDLETTNPLWDRIEPHFHEALDRLKPPDRAALLLRYVQDASLAEVGARLGIPENTARMRINRAMEKVRLHLSRAGIAVSVLMLATLLNERAAQALPASLLVVPWRYTAGGSPPPQPGPTRASVRRAAQSLHFAAWGRPLAVLCTIAVLVGGMAVYGGRQPQRLSPIEQSQFFKDLDGSWVGTLEYADDRSRKLYTLDTAVVFNSENAQNTLRFIAKYPRSDREDITTLTGDPRTGTFVVDNGGPRKSHSLHGAGELIKLGAGEFAFQGMNVATDARVRLRITNSRTRMTIHEEYLKHGRSDYHFRNRFTLHRPMGPP